MLNRRQFLKSIAALTGTPLTPWRAFAAGTPASALPARGELVLRNAYVITMEPRLGDIPGGDVHIKNGVILAVGKGLKAPGAEAIDGQRMIVLPGLVDTHWHMWNTLLRSLAGEKASQGYFPLTTAYGKIMTPDDMYHGARLAAAEGLYSGITTVHDFCHNARSRAHAEADIRALQEAGLRARWSYGWPQGLPDTEITKMADVEALHRDWANFSSEGLISMGFAWRGMFRNTALPRQVYRPEFEIARRLGLPISAHVGSGEAAKGQIAAHAKENLLGKDVQVVHALSASPAEMEMLAKAGSPVSVSPDTEMRIGYGFPKVGELLAAGVRVGISVDNTVLAGDANLFGLLKMVRNIENARSHDEFKMPARRVLELGTIEGARSLGMEDRVGSLKPGKRADVIMVSTRQLTMGVFTEPAHLLVEAAEPESVDTVIVDGRVLKRGGRLTSLAVDRIVSDAEGSFEAMRNRADQP